MIESSFKYLPSVTKVEPGLNTKMEGRQKKRWIKVHFTDLLVRVIGTLSQCMVKNIRYIQLHASTNVENSCVTKTQSNMLKELRDCLKGEMQIENFTVDEIKDIIDSICIY